MAHVFDDHEGGAVAHDVFAESGGSGGSDFVVDVEPAPDDGGVADAAGEFTSPSAGGASAGDVSVSVEDEEGDGVVVVFGVF